MCLRGVLSKWASGAVSHAGARPRGGVQPRADPNYVPGQAKRPWDVPADLGRETPEPPADFPAPRSPPATTSSADDDDWLAQFGACLPARAAAMAGRGAPRWALPTMLCSLACRRPRPTPARADAVIQSPAALAQAKAASKPAKPTHRCDYRKQ